MSSAKEEPSGKIDPPSAHTLATVVLIPSKDLKHIDLSIGTWSCACQEIGQDHLEKYSIMTMEPIVQVVPIHEFLNKIGQNGPGCMTFCDDRGKKYYFQAPNTALDLMKTIVEVEGRSCIFVTTHKTAGPTTTRGKLSPMPNSRKVDDRMLLGILAIGGLLLGMIIRKIFS
jgi:hypothetical protein